MSAFTSNLLLACVFCVLALAVFAFAVYMPTIARLDKDIKMVRILLLLFPDKVRGVGAVAVAPRSFDIV